MNSPFPYFGGKRTVAAAVWARLGSPKQYIEPFCGSAAVLLAAPRPAALEVVCDGSGFIANFWRAVKHQPAAVAEWADYPVSHIDLGARHGWLMAQRDRIGAEMQDPDWPGDAKVAGWWLWGQCCWIGSGWCDWFGQNPARERCRDGRQAIGRIRRRDGVQADSVAGRGVQAIGKSRTRAMPGGRAGDRQNPARQRCREGRRRAADLLWANSMGVAASAR